MNAQTPDHALRKAAILVASLDRETADRLVAEMPPAELERLYAEIAQLGTIDAAEQRTVIDEFFRGRPSPLDNGDTLELSAAVERQLAVSSSEARVEPTVSAPSFEPLRATDAATLAQILSEERPQIVALVMAQLAPLQAADVLNRLAPPMQVDVMRRLSDLDEPDAITLCEVERVLAGRLAHAVRDRQRRATGLAALDSILQSADSATARQLLANLVRHDRHLAARLQRDEPPAAPPPSSAVSPTPMSYAEFMDLDERSIRTVMQSADREIVLLALAGSTATFVSRVATVLGPAGARQLEQAIETLGPLLLSDLTEAQHELARLATDLLDEGAIAAPRRRAMLSMAA